jgi:vitamin B12 transporter
MQIRIRCVAAAVALAALAPVARSDSAAEGALDEIVVTATRSPQPQSRIGNSITVIDADAIRDSQQPAIADLLATVPGVSFARNGGVGELTSVFIRGADSDETLVLIDGVQLIDPWSTAGGVFFDNLLTAGAGRIEILRGAQSTLYGSQAMGGVVNIISAEPTTPFGGNVSVEAGSHGTGYVTGEVGGKDDALLWKLGADWYGTSGYPVYDRVFGGTRDDAAQVGGANGRVRYDFTPQVQLDVRAYYNQGRVDTDGYDTPTGAFGDDNEYSKKTQFVGYTGLTVASAERDFTNRIAFQYTDSAQHEYDPGPRYPAAYYANGDLETFYGSGHVAREEYQGTWVLDPQWHAVFGLQHELQTISSDTPAFDYAPAAVEQSATIDSGYVQLQGEVAPGLVLTAGERYDRHSEFGDHATGQLAAAWSLGGATILRASFGQGFKAPSLYELFGANGVGNATLRPETATSWDAGIEQHALDEALRLTATYFHRDSRDLIGFFDCPLSGGGPPQCAAAVFGGYYANIDEAKVHGVELQADYRPDSALTLAANYTLTVTENLSPGADGNQLPRRPRDAANASASYRFGGSLTATVAARYAGRTFSDVANTTPLGGYVLTDLRLGWQVEQQLELYARIEDATGKRYETAYGYGTPGRVVFAGLRAQF